MGTHPEQIGRYIIKSELGRGGMATVYRAEDPRFKRDVALKVLPPQFLHDPMFRARFEREAQTIAALEHPAIVPVYDFGEENGELYLVMRFMPGGSLQERMEKGPIPADQTVQIITRIAGALDQVHAQGIVHRDLKPANILFDQFGNAFLSDFGIARLAEAAVTLTGDNIVGTPAYMSPEQARGEKVIDGRSDIYALGAILFQMLSGHPPYEATTPMGVAMKHITDPVPDLRRARQDLPEESNQIISRAMAKDPAQRYQKSSELARDLETAITAKPPQPAQAAKPAVSASPMPRSPAPSPPPIRAAPLQQPVRPAPAAQPRRRSGIPTWVFIIGSVLLFGLCIGGGILSAGGLLALMAPEETPTTAFVETLEPVQPVVEVTEADITMPVEVSFFFDDFSDPNSGWERQSDATATTDYDAGGYRILVDRPNMTYGSTPSLSFSDVIIEVEATKIAGADENYFGIMCRLQDYNNLYTIAITSDGYYSIGLFEDGWYVDLGDDSYGFSDAIHTGTTSNILRAECIDDTITLFVNNIKVTSLVDDTFATGDVGLIAAAFDLAGTNILFDNFSAMQP